MNSNFQKLHLGCGPKFIDGFCHIDLLPAEHIDHVADVRDLSFIPDQSSELIYCSHVLEHFSRWEIPAILAEWFRVLAPEGVLRLAVPDFAACVAYYQEHHLNGGLSDLLGLICGGQKDQFDYHHVIFDDSYLRDLLFNAGFRIVESWDWRKTEHTWLDDFSQAHLPHMDKESGRLMSLNLQAIR